MRRVRKCGGAGAGGGAGCEESGKCRQDMGASSKPRFTETLLVAGLRVDWACAVCSPAQSIHHAMRTCLSRVAPDLTQS